MRSARLTIFEGPDGAGKTTLAQAYAKETNARYLHFDALRGIKTGAGLARHYAEAIMPAVLGYQDIVMDRCWLSEEPYAEVYHHEQGRLGRAHTRMLERLALRCGAVVVLCAPPLEVVRENYLSRQGEEMLESVAQLEQVYDRYKRHLLTHLPCVAYDYTGKTGNATVPPYYLEEFRGQRHSLAVGSTAGNWDARVVLVGQDFARHKDLDSYYQWPFASFSGAGCSRFLTDHLEEWGILESELLWVNADMVLEAIPFGERKVIALGELASMALNVLDVRHTLISHPQYHKRFKAGEPYLLGPQLVEMLK
jgi:hypothetical protein